jgi:DNA-directed RNA polymerase subunit RPC12/RpoP
MVEERKHRCPNCGSDRLVCIGFQWWPLSVIEKLGWYPFLCAESQEEGAIRYYRCEVCGRGFIEPSLGWTGD